LLFRRGAASLKNALPSRCRRRAPRPSLHCEGCLYARDRLARRLLV